MAIMAIYFQMYFISAI